MVRDQFSLPYKTTGQVTVSLYFDLNVFSYQEKIKNKLVLYPSKNVKQAIEMVKVLVFRSTQLILTVKRKLSLSSNFVTSQKQSTISHYKNKYKPKDHYVIKTYFILCEL
jgi:hypothetical protein